MIGVLVRGSAVPHTAIVEAAIQRLALFNHYIFYLFMLL